MGVIGLCAGFQSTVSAFSLTGAVSGLTSKVKPIVNIFTGFVSNMVNSLKKTDYNDQMIIVYDQQASSDPSNTPYSMAYDFGFRGGGDVNEPFGFTFDGLGRYVYQPMTAMLLPGVIPDITDPSGQRKKPLSLGDGVAPELIKGLLGIMVGGRANAEKIWAPFGHFLKVSPETMFLLKIIILVNTARKNTTVTTGIKGAYPTLLDVPFELMMLIFKLVITPDIQETVKLNPGFGPEKAFRWEKVVTISRPSRLLGKMPKFFVDLLNSFTPSVDSAEIQEYKDRFAAPISDMQLCYGDVRKQTPYEVRIGYAQNNVIDLIDLKTFNQSDKALLEYMIQQLIAERYRGLKTFIASTEMGSTTSTDQEGTIDYTTTARTSDDITTVSIDVNRMTTFLSTRIPKIKDFIAHLLAPEKKSWWGESLTGYLTAMAGSIDAEFDELTKMISDLTDARKALVAEREATGTTTSQASPQAILEQRIAQSIIDKLDAIAAQEEGQLGKLSGNKIPVPLPAYLDIQFWQTMRLMRQGFAGDNNYIMNDSLLTLPKAILQAYAICFRANLDLLYLENLIKTDSRPFVVKTNTGETLTATGVQLYKSYMDAERYLLYCRNKVSSYRASLGKMTAQQLLQDPQLIALQKDSNNASVLYSRARSAFRYQLRQFEFDRRLPRAKKVGRVLMGESSMSGLGDVNVITVAQPAASDQGASTTPATTPATPAPETVAVAAAAPVSETPAQPSVDDPFAAFNTATTTSSTVAALADESVSADTSTNDSGGTVEGGDASVFQNPVFDGAAPSAGMRASAQESFLGITPQAYDYSRSVNAFLMKEFALLLLRCPQFQDAANAQMDQMVFQMTGMHVNQLLRSVAGQKSDIASEEDKAFLPDNNFFSQKIPLASIGSATNHSEMDALGKALADKYGVDLSEDLGAAGDIMSEEASFSADVDNNPLAELADLSGEESSTSDESSSITDLSGLIGSDTTTSSSRGAASASDENQMSVAQALADEPIDGVSDAFAGLASDSAITDLSSADQQDLEREAAASDQSFGSQSSGSSAGSQDGVVDLSSLF